MKIDGYDVLGEPMTDVVKMHFPGETLEVRIQAYPFGFDVDQIIPLPVAPVVGVKMSRGEIVRDARGDPVILRDEDDEDYRRERQRAFWMRFAALFYYAVRDGGSVEFESVKGMDPEKNPVEFFGKVVDELKASGMTTEIVQKVNEAALRLSGVAGFQNIDSAAALAE